MYTVCVFIVLKVLLHELTSEVQANSSAEEGPRQEVWGWSSWRTHRKTPYVSWVCHVKSKAVLPRVVMPPRNAGMWRSHFLLHIYRELIQWSWAENTSIAILTSEGDTQLVLVSQKQCLSTSRQKAVWNLETQVEASAVLLNIPQLPLLRLLRASSEAANRHWLGSTII